MISTLGGVMMIAGLGVWAASVHPALGIAYAGFLLTQFFADEDDDPEALA